MTAYFPIVATSPKVTVTQTYSGPCSPPVTYVGPTPVTSPGGYANTAFSAGAGQALADLFTCSDCDDAKLIHWKLETSGSKTVPYLGSGTTVYSFQAKGGQLTESVVDAATTSDLQTSLNTTSTYDILKGVQTVSIRGRSNPIPTTACSQTSTFTGDGTFTWPIQIVKIDSNGP